jgi:hypothetical protein
VLHQNCLCLECKKNVHIYFPPHYMAVSNFAFVHIIYKCIWLEQLLCFCMLGSVLQLVWCLRSYVNGNRKKYSWSTIKVLLHSPCIFSTLTPNPDKRSSCRHPAIARTCCVAHWGPWEVFAKTACGILARNPGRLGRNEKVDTSHTNGKRRTGVVPQKGFCRLEHCIPIPDPLSPFTPFSLFLQTDLLSASLNLSVCFSAC